MYIFILEQEGNSNIDWIPHTAVVRGRGVIHPPCAPPEVNAELIFQISPHCAQRKGGTKGQTSPPLWTEGRGTDSHL